MKILVSGSSGFIGSVLIPYLQDKGFDVSRLIRKKTQSQIDIFWDPENGILERESVEGFDVIINLCGENIVGRWTQKKKNRIKTSRVNSASLISKTISELTNPPKLFISASAVGFYGNRGDEVLNEKSAIGKGFLAEVSNEWETAAKVNVNSGTRVVLLRSGLVLGKNGGALKQMLTPFKLGLGGMLGDGKQYWSWIALYDTLGSIFHIINTDSIQGPVNIVAPDPVTNKEFVHILSEVLKRPALFHMPGFIVRSIFGEMADEGLLSSTRVYPAKLTESGYKFNYHDLKKALNDIVYRI